MNLYVESSAVLSWLMRESAGQKVSRCLGQASVLATSVLTQLETMRSFHRAVAAGDLHPGQQSELIRLFGQKTADWTWLELSNPILARAEEGFPVEPIRSLDALHLASALELSPDTSQLTILSLDQRVRENAVALGFPVLP